MLKLVEACRDVLDVAILVLHQLPSLLFLYLHKVDILLLCIDSNTFEILYYVEKNNSDQSDENNS